MNLPSRLSMTAQRLFATLLCTAIIASCGPQSTPESPTGTGSSLSSATSAAPNADVPAIEPDLSNVEYMEAQLIGNDDARRKMAENGFVVTQGSGYEFFPTYESNRYAYRPNFVTTDSMLHTYHLLFDHILQKTEEEKLLPLANAMTEQMLAEALKQHAMLKGSNWENAAARNVGFFAVAKKLLDPSFTLPAVARAETDQEIKLIAAHDTIADSPLMNMGGTSAQTVDTPWGPLTPGALKEDYTQYIPRGHYDRTDALSRYFRAMMWYGRLSFRFKNPDEVKSAILITAALDQQTVRSQWEDLYEVTSFFVGKSDDLTFEQLNDIRTRIYKGKKVSEMAQEDALLMSFMKEAGTLPDPVINSMPIMRGDMEQDRTAEIKGFRFMGQRFTLDGAVMQKLICRDVGTKAGDLECGGGIEGSRMLPKSLDVAAALGSAEAMTLLADMGETQYKNYPENMQKLRTWIAGLAPATWTQNLYWGWLHSLRPLLASPPESAPAFMKNLAWTRKDLNTFFGSWTELRHDTILYAKQSYAELGGGPPEEQDDRGYVEPRPDVFERLATLTRLTREGLASRDLLPSSQAENLSLMEELCTRLATIARKELANEALTDAEYELIRSYGGQLEHLWLEVHKEDIERAGVSEYQFLQDNPAAIVADVATDPNGRVLEEATGYVDDIFVAFPIDGKLRLGKGAVYSYYEFTWPITDRLTDSRWRELLMSGENVPPRPTWTDVFFVEHE